MNPATLFQTQPLPFSRISGFTFYPPNTYPKDPDKIDALLHVNGPRSGYKTHLIQGDLSAQFLAGISCVICKGILNEPLSSLAAKACAGCCNMVYQQDRTLSDSMLGFNLYCPLYRRGCSWCGPIREATEHLEKDCMFVYQKCGYIEMGLCLRAEVLPRRELAEHYKSTHAAIEKVFSQVDTLTQENRKLKLENEFLTQTYTNGIIIIRLKDFDDQVGNTITSPIFQTHTPPNVEATHGYNLQVAIIFGSDKSLSAVITVKDGHSDDVLPWPMLVNYKATLFSFLSESQNAVCTLCCGQIPQQCREKGSVEAYGWAPLTTHEEMCSRTMLKDNTLYLMFEISFL